MKTRAFEAGARLGRKLRRQPWRTLFGTPFAYVTRRLALLAVIPGGAPPVKLAMAAAIAFVLYLANLILSFFLPEPRHDMLSA